MEYYVLILLVLFATVELLQEGVKAHAGNGFPDQNRWIHPVWMRRFWLPNEINLKIEPSVLYKKDMLFDSLFDIKTSFTLPLHRIFYPTLFQEVGNLENRGRVKRDVGEENGVGKIRDQRELVYEFVEKMLSNFGHSGRNCVLRIICEIHEYSLNEYGVAGEIAKVVFSPSRSQLAQIRLPHYLNAETHGAQKECGKFANKCGFSMFKWQKMF